jgi:uncharacterized membrane protein YozB (DUF420 family)
MRKRSPSCIPLRLGGQERSPESIPPNMDPKLFFWTAAIVDLGAVCLIAILGVRYARRGEIARHKRSMKIASLLVVAFLASYLLKSQFLGREDMSAWTPLDLWVLRIHELFVMQMLIGGVLAWIHGRKLLKTRLVTHDPEDPVPDPKTLQIHRIAGRTGVIGSVLAFLMALGILAGMFVRALGG